MVEIFKIKRARDFGNLVSAPFYYVRRHFKTLGKSVLYLVVPLIALASVVISQTAMQPFNLDPESIGTASYFTDLFVSSIVSSLVGLLTMTMLSAVVYHHLKLVADDTVESSSIQVETIWEGVKSDFFMLLLINIGVGLATMVGTIFLIIPGIYIAVKLLLVSAVYVTEDLELGDAFSRSWNLITNYWWQTFGLLVIMYIFVSMMSAAITFPFSIMTVLSGFSGFSDPESMGTFFSIFYGLTTSLTYTFYTIMYICLGLHYYNLVERKEGAWLSQRIDEIDEFGNTI